MAQQKGDALGIRKSIPSRQNSCRSKEKAKERKKLRSKLQKRDKYAFKNEGEGGEDGPLLLCHYHLGRERKATKRKGRPKNTGRQVWRNECGVEKKKNKKKKNGSENRRTFMLAKGGGDDFVGNRKTKRGFKAGGKGSEREERASRKEGVSRKVQLKRRKKHFQGEESQRKKGAVPWNGAAQRKPGEKGKALPPRHVRPFM